MSVETIVASENEEVTGSGQDCPVQTLSVVRFFFVGTGENPRFLTKDIEN